MKEGERAEVDLNDLMSGLDSGNATINNEEEARELTQNLVNTLEQLALSIKETPDTTTTGTSIQPSIKTDAKQGKEGDNAEGGTVIQGATPKPTKATISPEQIKHATVSCALHF